MPNYGGTITQNSRRSSIMNVPVGAVVSITMSTVSIPAGYIECNGQAISRTTYSLLFSILGTLYGAGDGSTTFNVPDYRGRFLRGANTFGTAPGSSGRNPENQGVAGTQVDAFQGHWHNVYGGNSSWASGGHISDYHDIPGLGGGTGAYAGNVQPDPSYGPNQTVKVASQTIAANVNTWYLIRAS